jgi:hypothetical protein
MAFMVGLALSFFALYGVFKFFSDKQARASFASEFRSSPFETIGIWLWALCTLCFFWTVLLQIDKEVKTPIGRLEIWQVFGLLSLTGLIVCIVVLYIRDRGK